MSEEVTSNVSINSIQGAKGRRQIRLMNEQYEAIRKLADPAERLLRYHELTECSTAVLAKLDRKESRFVVSSYVASLVGSLIAVAMCPPLAFPIMIGAPFAFAFACPLFFPTRKVKEIRDGSKNAEEYAYRYATTEGFLPSPHLEAVTKTFPYLKEKFRSTAECNEAAGSPKKNPPRQTVSEYPGYFGPSGPYSPPWGFRGR